MALEIRFRGVFLLNPRAPDGVEILIPNAELPPEDGGSALWSHADDDVANKHYSRLQVYGTDTSQPPIIRENLLGRTISFEASWKPPFTIDGSVDTIVPLNKVLSDQADEKLRIIAPGARDFWRRVATRVQLQSGHLMAREPAKHQWYFDDKFNAGHSHKTPKEVFLELVLTLDPKNAKDPTVTIEIADHAPGGTTKKVALTTEQPLAVISNFDTEWPTLPELNSDSGVPINVDVDYKWNFQLLRPPTGTLNEWRKGRWLPAPQRKLPKSGVESESITVSSCFWGRWGE